MGDVKGMSVAGWGGGGDTGLVLPSRGEGSGGGEYHTFIFPRAVTARV